MPLKIVSTKGTCSGSPRIEGTRLTCANVVSLLGDSEMQIEKFLSYHQNLQIEDLKECVNYCASKKCEKDKPENFCQGCTLDTREELAPNNFLNNAEQLREYIKDKERKGQAYLGSEEDYEELERPIDMWVVAAKVKLFNGW